VRQHENCGIDEHDEPHEVFHAHQVFSPAVLDLQVTNQPSSALATECRGLRALNGRTLVTRFCRARRRPAAKHLFADKTMTSLVIAWEVLIRHIQSSCIVCYKAAPRV